MVLHDDCRCGSTKIKMKFATYRSAGFNYRSRRPTFKPQKTEEATVSAGATTQPQAAEKPPVRCCQIIIKIEIHVHVIVISDHYYHRYNVITRAL